MPKATPAPRREGSEEEISESALYGIPETKILKFELDYKNTHITIETSNPKVLGEVLATISRISSSKEVNKVIGAKIDAEGNFIKTENTNDGDTENGDNKRTRRLY